MSKKYQLLGLVGCIAISAALHFWRLGEKPLWVDEAQAWGVATWGQYEPGHPPLYFQILGFTTAVLGSSEFALRVPSAGAAVLTVLGVWWLAGVAGFTGWTRWGTAAFTAVSPYLLLVGQQARMYGVAALLGAIFAGALWAWRGRGRLIWLIVAGAAAIAGVYTLFSFWFVLAGGLFLWPWGNRRAVALSVAAYLVVVLAYLPAAATTVAQVDATDFYSRWGLSVLAGGAKASLGALFYFGAGFAYHPSGGRSFAGFGLWRFVGLAAAAGAVFAPIIFGLVTTIKKDRSPLLWAGAGAAGLALNIVAPSGGEQLAAVFPLFVLLWVYGVSRLRRPWALLITGVWVFTAGHAVSAYYRCPTYPLHREDWRAAGEALRARYRPGDEIATMAGPGGPAAVRYYAHLDGLDVGHGGLGLEREELVDWLRREAVPRRRVFFLYGDWGDKKTFDAIRGLEREGLPVEIRRCGDGLVLFEIDGGGAFSPRRR